MLSPNSHDNDFAASGKLFVLQVEIQLYYDQEYVFLTCWL